MKLTKRIICMTAALGCFSGLYAQDTMTLKECMQYAVENSARMKIQQMDVDDARVARRDAILRVFTPEVSAVRILSSMRCLKDWKPEKK